MILGVTGAELSCEEAQRIRRINPAGFILFSRNIVTPKQTRKLTDELRSLVEHEPILAIDQEGGRVCRTSAIAPDAPSAAALAAHGDLTSVIESAIFTADLLRLLGLNMNFAPVLDLDHHPEAINALRGRTWGRDAQRVIDFAGNWNRWHRRRNVATCAKHFPAGGRAVSDPHFELPVSMATRDELLAEDVIPYTALMPELDAVMLAHVEFPQIDPDLPASLSPRMIRGFLREQLGFEKQVVITDDLDMAAISQRFGRGLDAKLAISAGNDLALICHRLESAEQAADEMASLPSEVLDAAQRRVKRLQKKLQGPLLWSETHWLETCAALARVADQVPSLSGQEAAGPVANY